MAKKEKKRGRKKYKRDDLEDGRNFLGKIETADASFNYHNKILCIKNLMHI